MADTPHPPPIKEQFVDGRPSGFEAVEESAAHGAPRAYNPEKIRVENKVFSLGQTLELIESKDLDLAPDFQRRRVWTEAQKNLLIESLLLRIPLPAFYFFGDLEGKLHVLDGFQRLSTIYQFVKGATDPTYGDSFHLCGRHLKYLKNLDQQNHDALAQKWKRRIKQTQLVVNLIDPQTPEPIKMEIFSRINTLGTALNAQELRYGLSKNRSRSFLQKLADLPEFKRAAGDIATTRMADLELVLRFCFFKTNPPHEETAAEPFEDQLNQFTKALDDPNRLKETDLADLEVAFKKAMVNAAEIFGAHAFRKYPLESDDLKPLNKPLFDCLAVVLSDHDAADLGPAQARILARFREATTPGAAFEALITQETNTAANIIARFQQCRDLVNAAVTS
ncbi:DUF262 domain-containing protein [Acanthopleuribacter pedis]|uniref:DUF262 domain-containing protein n=1 Tax=Acanthopleuribacter pedis TaxID=442870 RepID=A0A8J7QKX0_9BACT|nr:DUF262 domain-containing protein [Acanthopleuribacter pedis]MBO1319855.1 DUF262 domain-containing protein [Acanthopleuribacter pedis]